jgi:hypothetical protein
MNKHIVLALLALVALGAVVHAAGSEKTISCDDVTSAEAEEMGRYVGEDIAMRKWSGGPVECREECISSHAGGYGGGDKYTREKIKCMDTRTCKQTCATTVKQKGGKVSLPSPRGGRSRSPSPGQTNSQNEKVNDVTKGTGRSPSPSSGQPTSQKKSVNDVTKDTDRSPSPGLTTSQNVIVNDTKETIETAPLSDTEQKCTEHKEAAAALGPSVRDEYCQSKRVGCCRPQCHNKLMETPSLKGFVIKCKLIAACAEMCRA